MLCSAGRRRPGGDIGAGPRLGRPAGLCAGRLGWAQGGSPEGNPMISNCYGDALPAPSTVGLPIPPLPASKGSAHEGSIEGETVRCWADQE